METIADQQVLRELAEWQPEGAVASVYVAIDPADRSEGWRTELRHAVADLDPLVAERVLDRFPQDASLPHGRTQVGFLELGGAQREIWNGFQVTLDRTRAVESEQPFLAPLVELIDEGWPVGVVLVALENVRVLESALGELTELAGWELEITALDWRERKGPFRAGDTGSATSSSGRDQYRQRLDHNRERFLKEAGHLIASRYGDRGWRHVIVFGEGDRPSLLAKGLSQLDDRVHEIDQDLIRAPVNELAQRIDEEREHLNRAREEQLVTRLNEAIGAQPGAALGPDDVLQCAQEGRAREILYDAERDWEQRDGVSVDELLIQAALATSAEITPVEGLAAAALGEHDGAAAILRY